MNLAALTAYELIKEENLTDIHAKGYLLRHKKSGAKISLISNDDENKVFYIGFRTPVEDSTGVPHIIEHTVLCGSDKFPVKDPVCGTGEGFFKYILECHDLSGQDRLSGGKLQ